VIITSVEEKYKTRMLIVDFSEKLNLLHKKYTEMISQREKNKSSSKEKIDLWKKTVSRLEEIMEKIEEADVSHLKGLKGLESFFSLIEEFEAKKTFSKIINEVEIILAAEKLRNQKEVNIMRDEKK